MQRNMWKTTCAVNQDVLGQKEGPVGRPAGVSSNFTHSFIKHSGSQRSNHALLPRGSRLSRNGRAKGSEKGCHRMF